MTPIDPQLPIPELEKTVLHLYRQAPLSARMYLQIRVRNYPRLMWKTIPALSGNIVSLGAGYALLEAMVAIRNTGARIVASDRNPARVATAQNALGEIPNFTAEIADLRTGFPATSADGFLLLDLLHHLPPRVQVSVLESAARALPSGGLIVMKECGTKPAWKKWVNYLNDAIGAPFERTYPRSEEEWASLLNGFGLSTTATRLDTGTPYAHILIVGRKS